MATRTNQSVRSPWTRRCVIGFSTLLIAQTITFSVIGSSGTAHAAAAAPATDLKLSVASAVLMDAESGQILYDMNGDAILPPASMTKMMTEYLVFDALKEGKIKMEDTISISEYSAFLTKGGGNSGIAKDVGEQFTVKDMINAVAIYSDNGAAVALAEKIAGSEEKFAGMMNDTAKKFGLSSGAHFIDTTGLERADLKQYAPAGIEGETVFSAKDSALIAFHVVNEHPEILQYSSIPSLKLRPTDKEPMINYNYMLEGNAGVQNFKKYAYQGLDGLKTGHTDVAGYCFTGTAVRNGTRLISVVMNAKTRDASFMESRKLLDYGFTNFEKKTLIPAGTTLDELKTVNVKKATHSEVEVVTEKPLDALVKKGGTPTITRTAAANTDKQSAPIKKGQVLGKATITVDGGKPVEINLVAKDDVEKAGWFRLFFRSIGHFFGSLFHSIKNLF